MSTSTTWRLLLMLTVVATLAGCVASPAVGVYLKTTGSGPEEDMIGVINGLWRYDESENLARLKKLLPDWAEPDLERLSRRYQVRVGFDRAFFRPLFVDVALLPEGWSYATTSAAFTGSGESVQPGDLVVVRTQKGRLVDFVESVHRRCSDPPAEDELPELSVGCFDVAEFGKSGYGGKWYFWTAF